MNYSTLGVTRDEGRGSWFWCAWKTTIKGWRTRATPDAHGWEGSHVEAALAATTAARQWGEPVGNADVAKSVLGWKKYAAKGHTRAEVNARRDAAEKILRDAYVADFTARLESAKAAGMEWWFWEEERRKGIAMRDAIMGDTPGSLRELGLSAGASSDEIRKAYKRAALKAHPDHGGTTEAFVRLTKARDQALASVRT